MEEIISSPAVIVGGLAFITAIANASVQYLMNYKPNKKIEKIQVSVNDLKDQNKKEHESIVNLLNQHSESIKTYNYQIDIGTRISSISKNAIEYIESQDLSICINRFCDFIIYFLEDIIKIGIYNMSKEQIKSKVCLLKKDVYKDICGCYNNITSEDKKSLLKNFDSLYNTIIYIVDDNINDKTARLIVKVEDFTHEMVKQGIILYNKRGKNETE